MMPLFSREKSSLKGRWRLETVQDMRYSSSNPVSYSETSIKIYGSKEEIRARKSPETVDAPGFAPDASIPVTLYGAVGGIRTLGRLLAVTRFPVVLVMTTSIPLRISMLNSKHHYTKIGREVNTQFSLFRKKETERRSVSSLFVFTLTARARRASGSSRIPPSPAAAPPPAGGTGRRGCCCPSGRHRRGRSRPHSS